MIAQAAVLIDWILNIYWGRSLLQPRAKGAYVDMLDHIGSVTPAPYSKEIQSRTASPRQGKEATGIKKQKRILFLLTLFLRAFSKKKKRQQHFSSFDSELHLHGNASTISKNVKGKWLITLSLVFGLLYILSTIIASQLFIAGGTIPCLPTNFRLLFVYSERALMYFYFGKRLQLTFKNTAYAYSKVFLFVLLWIFLPLFVTGLVWYYYRSWHCTTSGIVEGYAVLVVLDCLYAIGLWCLFVSKMRQVIKQMNLSSRPAADNKSSEPLRIKRIINKFTILSSVMVVSSLISYILYLWLWTAPVLVDIVINGLGLVLSFQRYHLWYLFCCVTCRRCCEPKDLWT
ncbi:hypothetical protein RFI_08894 [Reticulomyxa filosa]|uniref:Uncharacterized protein n=1 Tax=Reticulomyxa filosa TaxID=46433 RepID=X6NPL5_RETFI|nr:hypothetical protein RFI_08894 [Reticulomyxa filosa]|eukprot:ETO28235.1 hypothetical protein RFI_08894 [Reticulomyxa filosa]